MRRADRLLQIVQILRRANGPVTARMIADELEVVVRTVYRDIAALQALRVPIDGEPGVGYLLRPGYDLPPLMFDTSEIEAIVLGLGMVVSRADGELATGAQNALAKIRTVVPQRMVDPFLKASLLVPHPADKGLSFGPHVPEIRKAIRGSFKLRISYADVDGAPTERTIWPLGLYLFSHATIVGAWCELRADYRAFRSERITSCEIQDDRFNGLNGAMMKEFVARFRS